MFFNLFIGDLPNCLPNCPERVSVCTDPIDYLLYADDVIIFSNSANGFALMLAAEPDKHLLNVHDAFKDLL
jgi:hypothetical protein